MSRHKDFDAARAESVGEPLTFRLAGYDFETVGEIPAGPLLDMAASVTSGSDVTGLSALQAFFAAIIPEERAKDFNDAIRKVGLTTMLELIQWIVEETTGRPLTSASSSAGPPSSNGAASKLALASVGWNPSP